MVSNRAHGEAVDRSGDELLAALHAGLRPTVFEPDAAPPRWSLQERMAHYKVPGFAVAVLKNGRVVAAAGFGVREARTHDVVDAGTLLGWFDPPTRWTCSATQYRHHPLNR